MWLRDRMFAMSVGLRPQHHTQNYRNNTLTVTSLYPSSQTSTRPQFTGVCSPVLWESNHEAPGGQLHAEG